MDYLRLQELEGKRIHDSVKSTPSRRCVLVPGPLIVGAGPSGLATAACLRAKGIPSLVVERFDRIASLWQLKTYDRLRLHLPKQYCELPLMPFPANFPTYPTKQQFVAYLESYAARFEIRPSFNTTVENAAFDRRCGFWRVRTKTTTKTTSSDGSEVVVAEEMEYACQWLVVATGENAEAVVPEMEGMGGFRGRVVHSSAYRSGEMFRGKSVLVVGCGNSGMEVCLDLCNYDARPSLVIRDSVHVLPQQMLGRSTFGLSMWLLKWFPMHLVDNFLLLVSRFMLGDTSRLGLHRPKIGPLQLKNACGKTPVLDIGTLDKIRKGNIKVFRGVRRITPHGAEFVDGRVESFDAIILATGYKSNVPTWLKESNMFNEKDGFPRKPFPNGWKGECGLYAVGFTKRGLLGASMDARRIAEDIESCWKADAKHLMAYTRGPSQ